MSETKKKLLVTGMEFLPDLVSQHIESAEIVCTSDVSEKSLSEQVKDFNGILFMQAMSYSITRKIIESGNELEFIQSAGAGYDQIDLDAATDHGVVVMNMPTATTVSVAEHAVALIMACAKNIVKSHKTIHDGGWRTMDFGIELLNKTLGIIGFGRIGKEVANRMKAFEMNTLVYDPYVRESDIKKIGARKTDLQTLLKESDIVTIHSPLTKETKGLIGQAQILLMKDSAILVNTARGELVDEKALFKALSEGRLKSAGLDVYEKEPLDADSPLLTLENVVLTPHSAVQTQDAVTRLMNQNGEQVEKALKGVYENVVNSQVLVTKKKLKKQ